MAEAQQKQEQQQQYMGQIFGALADVGSMFQKQEEMSAGVKAGEQFGKMFGKQLGMNMDFMSAPEYKNMDTASKYQFWQGNFFPSMGAMSNMMNNRARIGVQQNAPYVAQDIKNRQNIASGNVPYGGGMAPVEPPLPVADENLPAVGGAPMTAPSSSIPGGQSSIDAINRDRQRRGLPPIK